jgi:protein arginine N-methyltransferase 5
LAIEEATSEKYDFVVAPLVHPRHRRDAAGISAARAGPFTRTDRVMDSRRWTTMVVGRVSRWLDADSPSARLRASSENALEQELGWAAHLSVPAVLLPPPRSARCLNYARLVNGRVRREEGHAQIWLEIPLMRRKAVLRRLPAERAAALQHQLTEPHGPTPARPDAARPDNERDDADPWEAWNAFRCACDQSPTVSVCLVLTRALPESSVLEKWLGEPVKAVVLPTSIFLTNRSGFPTLPKAHQTFVRRVMAHGPQMIVRGSCRHAAGLSTYAEYVAHLNRTRPEPTAAEAFEAPYHDFLQAPLQPLMDNLESQTYETFERDPVKYKEYEDAVFAALVQLAAAEAGERLERDAVGATGELPTGERASSAPTGERASSAPPTLSPRAAADARAAKRPCRRREPPGDGAPGGVPVPPAPSGPGSSLPFWYARAEATDPPRAPVVMVVGAGRGPLVRASLRASERAQRAVRIIAVEKNPNAVVTLRAMRRELGWDKRGVEIVAGDMRACASPCEKADILVSELLGSFGDNELSPECLDGAQRFLKPGGVSIPCQYTSFLAPVMSAKLWNEAGATKDGLDGYDTGYVVKMHNFETLAPARPLFTFEHPVRLHPSSSDANASNANAHNARYRALRFRVRRATLVHGFAGYFEAPLFCAGPGRKCLTFAATAGTAPAETAGEREARLGPAAGASWNRGRILSRQECNGFLSINPATFSEGMFSWFPLFLPLRRPFYARAGETVEVHVWRRATAQKVWYEWAVAAPVASPVQNVNGKRYWIGL